MKVVKGIEKGSAGGGREERERRVTEESVRVREGVRQHLGDAKKRESNRIKRIGIIIVIVVVVCTMPLLYVPAFTCNFSPIFHPMRALIKYLYLHTKLGFNISSYDDRNKNNNSKKRHCHAAMLLLAYARAGIVCCKTIYSVWILASFTSF